MLIFAMLMGEKATSKREQRKFTCFAEQKWLHVINPSAQISILFKSKTEISPKLTEDRSNQCSFCVYAGGVRSARCPHIYHGVGILFLLCSFRKGVWRCPSFMDVRQQVSRLFLPHRFAPSTSLFRGVKFKSICIKKRKTVN